jgi:hypothetical protein
VAEELEIFLVCGITLYVVQLTLLVLEIGNVVVVSTALGEVHRGIYGTPK